MESQATHIFNHLDTPPRILIWPVSEVVVIVVPCIFLMALGQYLLAFITVAATLFSMRAFKKHIGVGAFRGLSFWLLPHSKEKYPVSPPSYIREFIG